MNNLQFHNSRFITYQDDVFTIDILGGVDVQEIERMISTLRITYKNYPPLRSTLDLYNDNQTDKLIRTLCDKWELALLDVSTSIHSMIIQLENFKLERLKYPKNYKENTFELSEEEQKEATLYLQDKNLIENLKKDFRKIGILGEDENALILFLAMASYKYVNPFSVICLAKSGIGKSYLLNKLSKCMPDNAVSFHTQISENAFYYFDSYQIDGKVLFIEDLEWTRKMLNPLATLQTGGRLIKTRATKNKDGLLHSTTFEVTGKLCLIACAYSEKKYESLSLPFLLLNLNHSSKQDFTIMEYQKKIRAGLINKDEITTTERRLKCVLSTLENKSVINPYAPLINLPDDLPNPRKTLLLLLNFIDIITFFFQHQRETTADKNTGEVLIKTAPEDIKLAFQLLENSLFRRADELSTNARGFYNWLTKFLAEAKTNQFTALDIRKTRSIHPRTLNNYLNELKLFSYVQVVGGNKHREGYIYRLTNINELNELKDGIKQCLKQTLDNINGKQEQAQKESKEEEIKEDKPTKQEEEKQESTQNNIKQPDQEEEPTFFEKNYKRKRINEKEKYTLKLLLELEAGEQGREYYPNDFTAITGRSKCTEARHLKTLWEQGILNREWKDRRYFYTLNKSATTSSKQDSKKVLSNPENLINQEKEAKKQ